jgi:DtxR family Mn-dependent transcriptional regulator
MIAASISGKGAEKPLTSVMEDYLEAIYDLDIEKKVVRVKDIAKRMDVKMPTVTSMLKTLSDRGLVHYEKYEYVELTHDGSDVGREMRRRHGILLDFLTDVLKIDQDTANDDACKMEHALSAATMDSLTDFMAFIQECPRSGGSWLNAFDEFRKHGHKSKTCGKNGKKDDS